jgi:Mn2+/Fe2+ NRAMP family transporter
MNRPAEGPANSSSQATSGANGGAVTAGAGRGFFGLLRGIGPAIITASVVIGPGSILTASKIGHQYAYSMVWIPVMASVLMLGTTAASAWLGVTLKGTLCEELARRTGRPIAILAGVALFVAAASFQFGNNLGVIAAIEPFYDTGFALPIAAIVGLNALVIAALFGLGRLYVPLEVLMKVLMGLMLIGFAGNLVLSQPDVAKIVDGLVPRLPPEALASVLPHWQPETIVNGKPVKAHVIDPLGLITAMLATTYSLGGAFYQSYLVRKKGWTSRDLRRGFVDTAIGIGTLSLITLMIMITAASVLHGQEGLELNSAADVARQLKPAFGAQAARILFCVGIFAAAFSSFLVNAMIGGTVLSDGLGLGGDIDTRWPKLCTLLVLMTGMTVAVGMKVLDVDKPVNLIVFAQGVTVVGVPVLAAAMLYLAIASRKESPRPVPMWMRCVLAVGLVLVLFLSVRTAVALVLPLLHGS